ncbi:MAG: dehypoxanthine futalosine cyclase, partial [Elusimicrobia bacterium]|nr:dehypoxanthine futalosine cyclase [Elusimicrobiota bacterium]
MTVLEEKKPRLKSDPSQRITSAEALSYYKNMDLLELGARANEIRFQKNPKPIVTFVIDSNPNYTNVCVTDCSFCAFYRKPGSVD